ECVVENTSRDVDAGTGRDDDTGKHADLPVAVDAQPLGVAVEREDRAHARRVLVARRLRIERVDAGLTERTRCAWKHRVEHTVVAAGAIRFVDATRGG